jgi:hypothetical protein
MTPFQVCPLRGRNEYFSNLKSCTTSGSRPLEENRQPARLRGPILPKTPGASNRKPYGNSITKK